MSYDEIEIEDMAWDEELNAFTYSCPCGDLFQITLVRNNCMRTCGSFAGVEIPMRAFNCTLERVPSAWTHIRKLPPCSHRKNCVLAKTLHGAPAVLCTLRLYTIL